MNTSEMSRFTNCVSKKQTHSQMKTITV